MEQTQSLSLKQQIESVSNSISIKKKQCSLLRLSEYGLIFLVPFTVALTLLDFCVLYLLVMRVAADIRVFAWPEFYLAVGLHVALTVGFITGCHYSIKHICIKHKKIIKLKQEIKEAKIEIKMLKNHSDI